uniref:G protein-coupled receptor 155a n=1 Tax=Oryzias melastigma TaxID=30732 RepID=A0A3B3BEP5_ORYME
MEGQSILYNLSVRMEDESDSVPSTMSIDKLLPALLECFGIILCGYIAGRTNIITNTQAKGLGNFVSKFALPALLFKNMVLLDFSDVIWPFLWSILIAKVSVFCIVCVLTLIVANPDSRYSKAGLFSIFATQSNDFALGYPIVEALYKSTHPEYLQYIYLVAPVSLMLLNPIGFALCEIQKWKNQENQEQQSKLRILGLVVLQVLKNPIVFMVVIGIIAHFVLHQTIPAFMAEFIDGLANSFGGAALFYLGLSMVGQLRKLARSTIVTLILLITAKLLLMPLICKDMVDLLDNNSTDAVNQSSLSDYAFLYGVFPTAPSVAIYAVYYNAELQVVTSGMVISTFLSAPIMYVSAWLLTVKRMDTQLVMNSLLSVSFNMSIVSLFALVWTITVMFLSKKYKRLPHMFTVNLFLAQLLTSIGMILWNFVVKEGNFIGQILTFTLLCTSLYSTYMWPAVLLRSSGLLVIAGWGIPCVVTAVLLCSGQKIPNTIDPLYFYGKEQVTKQTKSSSYSIAIIQSHLKFCLVCNQTPGSRENVVFNLFLSNVCLSPSSVECENCCESTDCLLGKMEELQQVGDKQVVRHVLLCLLLTVNLLANFSSSMWLLCNHAPGRLYLELLFFCAIVNYVQGFLSFAMFGLDKHLILLPFKRFFTQWFVKKPKQQLDLPDDIRMICSQFTKYHKQQCCCDIVKNRRCGRKTVVRCFLGCELVDWLLQVGLAQDRGEAVLYGTQLQQGGVLQHIKDEYSFQDSQLYFYFLS